METSRRGRRRRSFALPAQKAGERSALDVDPGCQLYVALIHDAHGTIMKVGSEKSADRLAALNLYRRPSQGEILWSLGKGLVHDFETPIGARDAEDFHISRAREEGFSSKDHSEFLVGISLSQMRQIFAEAVEAGDRAERGRQNG